MSELAEGSIAADELRLLIERIERLEEEKKAMADDIRDVYAEAKARGYDPKTMRSVVRLRKMENHVRQEAEALLDTYKAALGLRLNRARSAGKGERRWPATANIRTSCIARARRTRSARRPVLQALARDHGRGQDGRARSGHERAPARRRQRGQGAVHAQGQYPALDRQGVGRRCRELRGDPL